MLSTLSLGLMALASLSGKTIENNHLLTNEANILLACQTCGQNSEQIVNSIDIFSTSGTNDFTLFEFNNGSYAIIDKSLNEQVGHGIIENSIFNNLSSDSFILKTNNDYYVYDSFSNRFVNLETNNFLAQSNLGYKHLENYGFHQCKSTDYPNVTTIENYYYFDNLNRTYGDNADGICGIIASQILLGYYDTFYNDDIVDETFDVKGDYEYSTLPINKTSPSTDYNGQIQPRNNIFSEYLVQKSIEYNHENPHGAGMTDYQVRKLITKYLEYRNIEASISYHTAYGSYINYIESYINDNKPVIATLSDHFVVVYGYDDDYFYLDSGWNSSYYGTGRMPKSEFLYTNNTRMVLDIEIAEHKHSNNYLNQSNGYLYCGCGYHHSNRLIMEPSDWGFAEQYFFNWKTVTHNKDGLQFTSNRLRTGYIQSSVINLSPRRVGAGAAIFDIFLGHEIYEFNVELAWWSSNELETYGYADLIEHKINDDELTWYAYADDYLENTIPHGHQNKINRQYFLRQNTDGIRFDIQNERVGNQNRGRLSIGTMIFDYHL